MQPIPLRFRLQASLAVGQSNLPNISCIDLFILDTKAGGFAVGGALSQIFNNHEKVVA